MTAALPAMSPAIDSHITPSSSVSSVGEPFPAQPLSSSLSHRPSYLSRTYRQASTLFLTRRLPEALTTLTPLITATATHDASNDDGPALVAGASRSTRIKIWSLYLTLLNTIVEMDHEDAKDAFGHQEWKALCATVRDGQVWDLVVNNGYNKSDGNVDPDVIINLATLMLSHAPDQKLNQRKLETYLAMSDTPSFDLNVKLMQSSSPLAGAGHRYRSPASRASGTNTPRDLNARVKILELYTLHVLPRNKEWDYAREFIDASALLDDERRDAFLQALQIIRDDQEAQERLEQDASQLKGEIMHRYAREEPCRDASTLEDLQNHRKEQNRDQMRYVEPSSYTVTNTSEPTKNGNTPRLDIPQPRPLAEPPPLGSHEKSVQPPTLLARMSLVMSRLRAFIDEVAAEFKISSVFLVRLLAFTIGLLFVLSRKGTRLRLQRIMGLSWDRVKATAGMGTKVSYL